MREDFDPDNGAPVKREVCLALHPDERVIPLICRERNGHAGEHRHIGHGTTRAQHITWPNAD